MKTTEEIIGELAYKLQKKGFLNSRATDIGLAEILTSTITDIQREMIEDIKKKEGNITRLIYKNLSSLSEEHTSSYDNLAKDIVDSILNSLQSPAKEEVEG